MTRKLEGHAQQRSNSQDKMAEGWFVGFVEKGKQKYIFVTNFTSLNRADASNTGGLVAKEITMIFLHQYNLA